jgi:hypothetical protein
MSVMETIKDGAERATGMGRQVKRKPRSLFARARRMAFG